MLLCNTTPVTSFMEKLILMKDVGHVFQLTGSRFFGTETSNSDWDFFTQDSKGVRLWLSTNGFELYPNTSSYAGDGFCVDVFVYKDEDCDTNPSHQIHVQIVKDFALKQEIQNKLASMYDNFPTDKIIARSIWTQAFDFYSMGYNDGYQIGVRNGHDLATLVNS